MPAPDNISKLVDKFEQNLNDYHETTPHQESIGEESTRSERQVESTDSQIDKLVYELYGLSADEIKIVEGN